METQNEWTDAPAKDGYYWMQFAGVNPSVVNVKDGFVGFFDDTAHWWEVRKIQEFTNGTVRFFGPIRWPENLAYPKIMQME